MNNTNNLTLNNLMITNPSQTVNNINNPNIINNNINSLIISSKNSIIPLTDEVIFYFLIN